MTDSPSLRERITEEFRRRMGRAPAALVRAPGRVNLIGDHTDYNDGFVLPMAIDRAVWIALVPRRDRVVTLRSIDFADTATVELDHLQRAGDGWIEYVKGVAWVLGDAGYPVSGWDGVIGGDVPIGAGLSSSAALELAAAQAFLAAASVPRETLPSPIDLAKLGQRAEREWVGMNCGIMDQMISAAGRRDHALLIDCRSLASELVPVPQDADVVVLDTATRRGLVDSAYNERRTQCEAAARVLGVPALRDLSPAVLAQRAGELEPIMQRRARHVVTENDRTQRAATAMRNHESAAVGALMNQSHASLRDDFEVSSSALDIMVERAQAQPGCLGARLTGAGFGGCAVALVAAGATEAFIAAVTAEYRQAAGQVPNAYVYKAADGAAIVTEEDVA